jgi:hypothetical protein
MDAEAERHVTAHLRAIDPVALRVLDREDSFVAQLEALYGEREAERAENGGLSAQELVVEQRMTVLAHHHGVDHARHRTMRAEAPRDRAHHGRRAKRARLDRRDGVMRQHGLNLFSNHFCGNLLHGKHGARALRDDRRGHRQPVDPASGERLEIGLQPGSAAGIGTSDG